MLFLNTYVVNASGLRDAWGLLDSTQLIDETSYSGSVSFQVCPISESISISNGRYTGTGSGSYSGSETGSYSGSQSGSYIGSSTHTSGSLSTTLIGTGGSQSFSGNYSSTNGSVSTNGYVSMNGSSISGYSGTQTISVAGTAGVNSNGALTMSEGGSISSSESGTTSSSESGTTSSNDNGTFTLSVTNTGHSVMHYHIPISFYVPLLDGVSINPNEYYGFYSSIVANSVSTTRGTVKNIILSADTGTTVRKLGENFGPVFMLGSQLLGLNGSTVGCILYLDFDYSLDNFDGVVDVSMNFNITPRLRHVKQSMQSVVGDNISSDIVQHQLTEESNEIASDTNSTTHSIFDLITDFFGSFFSNLIGVFVPEDGYFTTWFNNLNSLLEAKLGILYYPFAKIIYVLNRFSSAFNGSINARITFPAIEFTNLATGETYTFLSAQTVNLDNFNIATPSSPNSSLVGSTPYASLVNIIRNINGFILVMALLSLLRQKLNLILRGDDYDS